MSTKLLLASIALLLIGVMGVIAAVNGAVFGYVLWGIGLVGGPPSPPRR